MNSLKSICVTGFGIALVLGSLVSGDEPVRFRRHAINPQSEFSAAAAIDVNQDGKLDIVSGAWWYASPKWERHRLREVELIGNRFDDYSNLPLDVDQDGDLDLVSINYRSKSLYWVSNPGRSGGEWPKFVIDTPGPSETGFLADINNDGQLDLVPNGTKFAAWYSRSSNRDGSGKVQYLRHDLPEEIVGHGIGVGDINGDGRVDLVSPNGWAEGPKDPIKDRWLWHAEFKLFRDCSVPMICTDVDRDGDTDIIWGRGHNVGLYWTEQRSGDKKFAADSPLLSQLPAEIGAALVGETKWVTHAIDTSWAAAHAILIGDIDGDGRQDLVAGKRFQGHDGRDPGENDPLAIYWYKFIEASRTWQRHTISLGAGCGMDLDPKLVDIDADGDLDILAPARSGLHLLENLRISAEQTQPVSASRELPSVPTYTNHSDLSYHLAEDGKKLPTKTALDVGQRREHVRYHMQQAMGTLPGSQSRVPLEVRIDDVQATGKYLRIKLSYAADHNSRVPAYLLVPNTLQAPAPAMLCLHPTNFELGKAQICGMGGKPSRFYAHELAELGFICLAPDYPSFGDYKYDFTNTQTGYASGTMKAIWDNVRAIDLLESLPIVRHDAIGCIGHSLGGHNALFTAALDGRIRCVVSSCGFNAFADYYGGDLTGWTSPRYMPLIRTRYQNDPQQVPFDFGEVLAAISPRPIFVNAPLNDANFAVVGVRKCQASVEPIYKLLDAERELTFVYPASDHDFPDMVRQQAYEWLTDKLSNTRD